MNWICFAIYPLYARRRKKKSFSHFCIKMSAFPIQRDFSMNMVNFLYIWQNNFHFIRFVEWLPFGHWNGIVEMNWHYLLVEKWEEKELFSHSFRWVMRSVFQQLANESLQTSFGSVCMHAVRQNDRCSPLIVELTRMPISRCNAHTQTRTNFEYWFFRFADWALKLAWTIFIQKARLWSLYSQRCVNISYGRSYLAIINSLHMFNGHTFWMKKKIQSHTYFFLQLIWFLLFLKLCTHTQIRYKLFIENLLPIEIRKCLFVTLARAVK